MKTYVIERTERGVVVTVSDGERETRELTPDCSLRYANHSPTGFEYGYLGSGPAQLALAILLDFYGTENDEWRYYQLFKAEVIAKVPQEKRLWSLTGKEIDDIMLKLRLLHG